MSGTCSQLNATLLRRVAHAVDGIRTGQEVYVVVDRDPPFRVTLVTDNQKEAAAAAEKDETLCYCGPYTTAREDGPVFLVHCHEPDSDWCEEAYITRGTFNPPRTTPDNRKPHLPKETDVERIKVEWTLRDGTTESRTFRWGRLPDGKGTVPHMVDALFFTQAAIDKFVVPYITSVQTTKTGFEVSQRLREGIEKVLADGNSRGRNGRKRIVRLSAMTKVARMVPADAPGAKAQGSKGG